MFLLASLYFAEEMKESLENKVSNTKELINNTKELISDFKICFFKRR